jgi:8-oxo-dGTP pyrophosphatase MutT (NUDIX family)
MNNRYIKKIRNNIYCSNCGKNGHRYKKCFNPTISLGIVCFKYDTHHINNIYKCNLHNDIYNIDTHKNIDNIKYLIVQRKHSLCYMEFIRGKYILKNINYIINIFTKMTPIERNNISIYSFNELWNNLWLLDHKTNLYKNEYHDSKNKFDILKSGIDLIHNNKLIQFSIDYILNNTDALYLTPEWGFPKGRRNMRESDIDCANREFIEETNLSNDDYTIINSLPINEIFTGSNHIRYKHTYFIAQCNNNIVPSINDYNHYQQIEIGDLGWYTYDEIINKFRSHDIEKKKILTKVHTFIHKIINNEIQLLHNESSK